MKNKLPFFAFIIIVLMFGQNVICQISCTICDTKAWNTPIGDCSSGHTDLDVIEWPDSLPMVNSGISIQDLIKNPMIHPNDVSPRIDAVCSNLVIAFNDNVRKIGDLVSIERIWKIINKETGQNNSYTQLINTTVSNTILRKICVEDANGILMDNVKLLDAVFTNKNNCTEIEYAESNKKIIPSREDMDASGIDVIDLVMLQNKVLKGIDLNEFQIISADINRDGKPTMADVNDLGKIINNEILNEPINWRFYYVSNWLGHFSEPFFPWEELSPTYYADISSVNQSYTFRGFKMGDIDHSYGREYPMVSILSKDKILSTDEEYDLLLKVDRPHLLEGFQMDIIKSPEIEILGIDSPSLPNFSQYHITELSDRKRVLWINGLVEDGVTFGKDDPIIVLRIKAKADFKLSDAFKIGTPDRNKIKSINAKYPNYQIGLEWTDLISSIESVKKEDDYLIYPNPANDKIFIKSNEKLNYISIQDLSGKSVMQFNNIENGISISALQQGLYIMQMHTISNKIIMRKLIVSR